MLVLKGHPNMRMALYIVSILVNGAAIVVRPLAAEWGDALQYIGGALAAVTGIVALGNVERESTINRVARKIESGEVSIPPTVRCPFLQADGQQCILGAGHDETFGHPVEPHA